MKNQGVTMQQNGSAQPVRHPPVPIRSHYTSLSKAHPGYGFTPTMTSSAVQLPDTKTTEMEVPSCGLSHSFVSGMKRLFQLIDTQAQGRVRLQDVLSKWDSGVDDQLSSCVIQSLSKVATNDGYLTFERFCAGIKIAIVRHDAGLHSRTGSSLSANMSSPVSPIVNPLQDHPSSSSCHQFNLQDSPLSRTTSLPILPGSLRIAPGYQNQPASSNAHTNPQPVSCARAGSTSAGMPELPPAKPPRVHGSMISLPVAVASNACPNISPYIHVDRVEAPIQFIWKAPPPEMRLPCSYDIVIDRHTIQSHDAKSEIVVKSAVEQREEEEEDKQSSHTLYWEESRRLLNEGLDVLERTCSWYHRLLHLAERRLQQPSPATNLHEDASSDQTIDLTVIEDLNCKLTNCTAGIASSVCHWDSGLGNEDDDSAASGGSMDHGEQWNRERRIDRLVQQNRMLTDEVSRKSQLITELEQEKRTLIRQLFQQTPSLFMQNKNSMRITADGRQ